MRAPPVPLLLRLWLGFSRLFPGVLRAMARRAHLRMQAPPARLCERFGTPGLTRPAGQLVWLNAASVGEVTSVLKLAQLIMQSEGVILLVTTTSATGAKVVETRLPEALHQFAPLDTPAAVTSFLDHWRPDAALFVEGDLWPRMMQALAQRAIPAALLNARPSKTRQRAPKSFAAMLRPFRLITLQEESLRDEFLRLGVPAQILHAPGNLKADITPPTADVALVDQMREAAGRRRIWAAASIHEGEEVIALDAARLLQEPAFLLLAPRHPARGDEIAAELTRRGLGFSRQSLAQLPSTATQVHLVDTLGMMGTVYSLAEIALVGGSLLPGPGGHSPYEAAELGCPILTGPYTGNSAAAYRDLIRAGAALEVKGATDLAQTLAALLAEPAKLNHMQTVARQEKSRHSGSSQRSLSLLIPLIRATKDATEHPNSPFREIQTKSDAPE